MKKGVDFTGVTLVFICHDGNGNILMQKRTENCRDEHNTWDCGGGGLRFGEKIDEGLAREINEELCTEIISKKFLGFRDVHREHSGKKTHWIALDFLLHIDRDKVKVGEPHKISEIGWFKLDSLPKPLHSQVPSTFEGYYKTLFEKIRPE